MDYLKTQIATYILRKRVKNADFTIVANNCWGGRIYQELGLRYNTPFVGLFLYAPCYMKLLGNLKYYLCSEITFVNESKYGIANEAREQTGKHYPIGVLGNDIELHFLHYKDEFEAEKAWCARLQRMNMNNLFVAFSDRDLCDEDLLAEFDHLDYAHKVCFTAKEYPNIRCSVWIKEYRNEPFIGDIYINAYLCKRHFDVADWLNGGTGRMGPVMKLVNRILEVRP